MSFSDASERCSRSTRPSRRHRARLGALLLLLCQPACVELDREVVEPAAEPRTADLGAPFERYRVGFATVDITPNPGAPLGGHSKEGATGYGAWGRLEARAVYIEDARGEAVVLVACDLWSVSAAFADRVVARANAEHYVGLRREQVSVAATHTHHSPGNFSGEPMYNAFASAKGGFDPALEAFLVDRVARSLAQAKASARPSTLSYARTTVPLVARQRSLPAFVRTPESAQLLSANAGLPPCDEATARLQTDASADLCRAVDPTLHRILVHDDAGELAGAVATFAVHPVAMPRDVDLYHADLFGVARGVAEAVPPTSTTRRPTFVLFNGAQGDVSPNYEQQGRQATLALGQTLGHALRADATDAQPMRGPIAHTMSRTSLAAQNIDGHQTSARVIPGRAQFAGTEDGRTHRAGRRNYEGARTDRERFAGQGAKLPAIAPFLLAIGLPKRHTPHTVPLLTHRIGDAQLLALPGEFTTALGARLVAAAAELHPGPTVLLGLSDGYASYFTTPEGYAAQHYEGGSTLFGTWSGAWLVRAIVKTAAGSMPAASQPPPARPGITRSFELRASSRGRVRAASHRTPAQLAASERWSFDFDDTNPWRGAQPDGVPRAQLQRRSPEGHWVAASRTNAASLPDFEFSVELVDVRRHALRWRARWLGTAEEAAGGRLVAEADAFRLRAETLSGTPRCSAAFRLRDTPHALPAVPCAEQASASASTPQRARDRLGGDDTD